jgi:hypothetical protein
MNQFTGYSIAFCCLLLATVFVASVFISLMM